MPTTSMSSAPDEQLRQAGAHHRRGRRPPAPVISGRPVVIACSTSRRTVVPCPGLRTAPPAGRRASATRLASPRSPKRARVARRRRVEPDAVVDDVEHDRVGPSPGHRARRGGRRGVPDARCGPPPGPPARPGRPLRRGRPATPVDRAPRPRSRPRRPGRSGRRARRPGRRRAGRAGGSRPAASAATAGRRAARRRRSRGVGAQRGRRLAGRGRPRRRRTRCRRGPGRRRRAGRGRSGGARRPTRRSAETSSRSRSRAAPVSRRVSTQIIGVASASSASSAPTVIRRNGRNTSLLALVDVGGRVVRLEQQRVALRASGSGCRPRPARRCRARTGSPGLARSETSASVPPAREDLAAPPRRAA